MVFVPVRPLQPSLMFADKATSLPKCGVPERCSTVRSSGLTCKHWTRLESLPGPNTLAYYKYSQITEENSLITLAHSLCYKTFIW